MKNIIKQDSRWTMLIIFSLLILVNCKSREKQLQKSESEKYKIVNTNSTIKKDSLKIDISKFIQTDFRTNFVQNSETKKDETKDVQIIKEYYENGNLKSEINKSFSQLSEATKTAISAMREELSRQKETSTYWKSSSDKYYQLYQEEKQKNSTKNLNVKSKPNYTWQLFFVGLFLGWLLLPKFFRWIWSLLLRLVPFANFIEWLKTLKK